MELPDKIYDEVDALSTKGNDLMDDEHFDAAIEKWTQALDLLPAPKTDWEAYMWLSASIGDAQFQQRRYELARDALLDALNAPGGVENPFVHFRLGQCQVKLGNEALAVESLLKAYMLDGEEIFLAEDDGVVFLKMLQDRKLVD
ncbi:TPA: tetratricopeptide repeat protein [Pseudomonas aeruginosa]|uniref:tetratricopeptide repeat protein n=1 Tax=Pseudomonas aeruginosa TaxID=287 RepID=UPI000EB329AA|nr:tetratricopeptide repeat protein [Pseudomonas aeruginosa]